MKRITVMTDIGQTVYVVFASKREGYKSNIVFRATVTGITIKEDKRPIYTCKINKCVAGNENINEYVQWFRYYGSNVDTGARGTVGNNLIGNTCPIFTDKEKCLKWMKG